MRRSVGLILMTKKKQVNGELVTAAILQRRGRWDTENDHPETYPDCCQVTVHGKIHREEIPLEALFRESCEELGTEFTRTCEKNISVSRLVEVKDEHQEVITYGGTIISSFLKIAQLGPSSGGFDLVTEEEVEKIIPITPQMKHTGPPAGVRAMFQDEIDSVKKAFSVFRQKY